MVERRVSPRLLVEKVLVEEATCAEDMVADEKQR